MGTASGTVIGGGLAGKTSSDLVNEGATGIEMVRHNIEARLVAGATGALIAVVITTPGALSGFGEIVKGIGEIVPF